MRLLSILNFLFTKTFRLYFKESNTKKLYKFSILPTECLDIEMSFCALFLLTCPAVNIFFFKLIFFPSTQILYFFSDRIFISSIIKLFPLFSCSLI